MNLTTDVLIVGSGVAGLYCALNLPDNLQVTVITKAKLYECDSYLAQGGICVLRNDEDYNSYFEDTLRAGHYENSKESVDIMIKSSRMVIEDLVKLGVDFTKDKAGNFIYTKEGAHSVPRILFHEDITGKVITEALMKEVQTRKNIKLIEYLTMIDVISSEIKGMRRCRGIVAVHSGKDSYTSDKLITIEAANTVLACGGIGGLYEHSTNYEHLKGDAIGIAIKNGIRLRNIDYIQIHPTTLYTEKPGRAFLISESVRGEEGILLNEEGKRFVNELLPRDVVTEAIFAEIMLDELSSKNIIYKPYKKDPLKSRDVTFNIKQGESIEHIMQQMSLVKGIYEIKVKDVYKKDDGTGNVTISVILED